MGGDFDGHLLQSLYVLYLVDEGEEEGEAGFEEAVEAAEALDYPGLLLRNEFNELYHGKGKIICGAHTVLAGRGLGLGR